MSNGRELPNYWCAGLNCCPVGPQHTAALWGVSARSPPRLFFGCYTPAVQIHHEKGCDLLPPAHMLSLRQEVQSGIDGASSVAVRVSARLATQAGSVAS